MVRFLVALLIALPAFAQTFNRINVYGFAGKSLTGRIGQADVGAFNLELGHATSPRFEYGVVFTPMSIRQEKSGYDDQLGPGQQNVSAFVTSLFARYHFRADAARVRPYAELSSGPMYSEKRVPAGTSRINFYSQGGVGVTFHPRERYGILLGFRFGHISNGGIEGEKNPGYNTNCLVVGVQLRPMPSP